MRCNRILCALLAAMMMVASLPITALAVETSTSEQAPTISTETEDLPAAEESGSTGNLLNGGMAVSDEDTVYYADPEDSGCLYRNQNGNITKLTDFGVQYLNLWEGSLYYTVVDGAERLTKIGRYDLSTGQYGTLFAIDLEKGIKNLIVQKGICYFITNGTVRSLNIQTGAQETLLGGRSDVTGFLLYDSGFAYSTCDENGNTPIYVYSYTTGETTEVTQSGGSFDIANDTVYFADTSDEYRLHQVSVTGESEETLTNSAVCNIVAENGNVYYKERGEESPVVRYDLSSGTETTESEDCTTFTLLDGEDVLTASAPAAALTDSLEVPQTHVNGVATGVYKTWKQYDSRWGSLPVGNGGTMRSIGCLVTSLAMCAVHSGIRSEDDFDPGTFVTMLNNNGGFASGGNLYWYKVSEVIPEFQVNVWNYKLSGLSKAEKTEIIQSHLDAGRQVVVSVNNGGHWVAVDYVANGDVIIMDPGYLRTSLYGDYDHTSVYQLAAYDVDGGTINPSEQLIPYEVTGDSVNYRDKPSTSGKSKGTLKKEDTVQVVAGYAQVANGYTWYKIKVNNSYYYVASDYLKKIIVAPTEIVLSETKCSVAVEGKFTLNAAIRPAGAESDITWSSSDKTIAKVSSAGVITGVKEGTAVITAKTENGIKATCTVTVTEKETLLDYVTTDALNYRASPGGALKGTLTKGAAVKVIQGATETNDLGLWYKIKIGNDYYYAFAEYLKTPEEIANEPKITLSKTSASLEEGKTLTLTAKVTPSTQSQTVTWSSSDKSVATVTSKGVITAVKKGTTKITVKNADGLTATCTVTVKEPEVLTEYKITTTVNYRTSPSLSGSVKNTLPTGTTVQVVEGYSKKADNITWYQIKLNHTYYYIASQYLKKANVAVTAVKLNHSKAEVSEDEKLTLTATITPSDSENKTITWSSSDKSVATVTSKGVVTGIKAGTAKITAKSNNGKTATCTITVTPKVEVTKVTITPAKASVTVGKTLELAAEVTPENAADKTIKWSTSNKTIATVSSEGVVTGVKKGSVTITAKSTNGKKATCTVTVQNPVAVKRVVLSSTTASVTEGETVALTATVSPENAADPSVTWSSSDKTIATVDAAGVVHGVKAGTVTITATSNNKKTATCKVTVKAPEVLVKYLTTEQVHYRITPSSTGKSAGILKKGASVSVVSGYRKTANNLKWYKIKKSGKYYYIAAKYLKKAPVAVTAVTLSDSSATLLKGSTVTLKAAVTPTNATDKTVKWSSSKPSVATVTAKGVVKGIKAGSTTITATSSNGKKATCKITVKNPVAVKSVKLNKTTANLLTGNTLTLKATVAPSNAADKTVSWSSSNPAIATVTKGGVVKGKKSGTVTITARTSNGKKATCKITVRKPEVLVKYKAVEAVHYRAKPSTSGKDMGVLKSGKTVSVVSGYRKTANGYKWYKVKISGKYYYVAAKYLKKV